jgi:hypothetical protein
MQKAESKEKHMQKAGSKEKQICRRQEVRKNRYAEGRK